MLKLVLDAKIDDAAQPQIEQQHATLMMIRPLFFRAGASEDLKVVSREWMERPALVGLSPVDPERDRSEPLGIRVRPTGLLKNFDRLSLRDE
jgi:hypothetical protein